MESTTQENGSDSSAQSRADLRAEPRSEPTPIADFIARPDFPDCAFNQLVEIRGFVGTVTDIVGNSLKVEASDRTKMSYNVHVLRRLYAPRVEREPRAQAAPQPEPEPPKPEVIAEPNFDAPMKLITDMVNRPDYPQGALGQHLDIAGYHGVVVQVINRSLKVRSRDGATRSYNADQLRRIHGAPAQPGSP